MIGTYKLDAEVWALPFPLTLSVRPQPGIRIFSVLFIDDRRPPKRVAYYGPLLGLGDHEAVRDLIDWMSDSEPHGLGVEAVHHVGSLLAALWTDRYVRDVPDITRKESSE